MIDASPAGVRACPICGSALGFAHRFEERPPGETPFALAPSERYDRELWLCERCGHYVSVGGPDMTGVYEGDYSETTYGTDGMRDAFDRIMSLPEGSSDNVQRVSRVLDRFAVGGMSSGGTVLDVGSGLAVFPARMREAGWRAVALDPDPKAIEHARDVAGVEGICADFMAADGDFGGFDLVSLNKVLEHVTDPIAMLSRAGRCLNEDGLVYLEVPDGTLAALDPAFPDREEFYVEHLHCFSAESLALLIARARLVLDKFDRIRDPSDKYTLAAFARPGPAASDARP